MKKEVKRRRKRSYSDSTRSSNSSRRTRSRSPIRDIRPRGGSRQRSEKNSRNRSLVRDIQSRGRSRQRTENKNRGLSNERFQRGSSNGSLASSQISRGSSRGHDSFVSEASQSGRRSPKKSPSREPYASIETQKNPQSVKKNSATEDADLAQLGGDPFASENVSKEINKTLSTLWYKVMQIGLTKEIRKDLIEKHPPAENCSMMAAPILNSEIKNIIGQIGVKKDQFQTASQNELGAAISALGTSLTKLLSFQKSNENDKELITEILTSLSDCGKLLTDIHHEITLTRRNFITSGRDLKLKIVAKNSLVDRLLFGEHFAKQFKAAREVEKVGRELNRPSTKPERRKPYQQNFRPRQTLSRTGDLNWRGPHRKSYSNPRKGGPQSQPARTIRNPQTRN